MPPITTAILLVTVFVVDEVGVPPTKTVPVAAGRVAVFVPEIAGASRVIEPLVSPVIIIELIFTPYVLMMKLMPKYGGMLAFVPLEPAEATVMAGVTEFVKPTVADVPPPSN